MREPLTTNHASPIGRRLADAVDVHIHLSDEDRAGQIYRQLRLAILERRLREGDRLPPTRELARRLGVSRTTTSVAYDRLISEGFAVARTGAGTFVSQVRSQPPRRPMPATHLRPLPAWQRIPLPDYLWEEAEFDFRPGMPDVALFPFPTWRRLMSRQFQPARLPRNCSRRTPSRANAISAMGRGRGRRARSAQPRFVNGSSAFANCARNSIRSGR